MYSGKQTDIITYLLTWLLTYSWATAATAMNSSSPSAPLPPAQPSPRTNVAVDPCDLITTFAKDEAAFSTCAITSGNKMCKLCVTQIMMLTSSYTKLITSMNAMAARNDGSFRCIHSASAGDPSSKDLRDRFTQFYSQSQMMWLDNNCDQCFMESSEVMRDEVVGFFIGASDFDDCLRINPNDTCDSCKQQYSAMNNHYERLEDEYQGNVCLDVTAVMIEFRDKWFSLGCISPLAFDGLAIGIGAGVIASCLLLYLVSRRFSRTLSPGLLNQKRLSMFTTTDPKTINNSPDERTYLFSDSGVA